MTGKNLLEIFYKAFNANTKVVSDTIIGWTLMSLHWEHASEILDSITKTNLEWHTWEEDRLVGTYAIKSSTINEH